GDILVDRRGEVVDESLRGIRRLIHDDVGTWSDAARLLDIERGLARAAVVARRTGPAVDLHFLDAIAVDLEAEGIPVEIGIAWRERGKRDDSDRPAVARDSALIERVDIVVLAEVDHRPF